MERVHTQYVGAWTLTLLTLATFRTRRGRLVPGVGQPETLSFPSNVLLCRRGDQTILVDAGEGTLGPPAAIPSSQENPIALERALDSVGCAVEDVNVVVVTHLDFDHANGIVTGRRGKLTPRFPTACVVFPAGAFEYVNSRRLRRAEMDSRLALETLRSADGEVRTVADGDEAIPGMRLLFVPGHREVHAAIEIREGSDRFLYLADVFHLPEEIEHPEWQHGSDIDADPFQAAETRRTVLEAIDPRDLVAASHIAGFGRIECFDDGRLWRPLGGPTPPPS
jgi:glyoxylase-like metal-dependent hydrolase (beta-lactamase superfamily II)